MRILAAFILIGCMTLGVVILSQLTSGTDKYSGGMSICKSKKFGKVYKICGFGCLPDDHFVGFRMENPSFCTNPTQKNCSRVLIFRTHSRNATAYCRYFGYKNGARMPNGKITCVTTTLQCPEKTTSSVLRQ
jgi:hypothetical protein